MLKLILTITACCLHPNLQAQFTMRDFEPLYLLSGRWKMETEKGILIEEWNKVNDSVLQNKSFRVTGRDTVPQETVRLKFSNGSITFTPTLPDQNDGKPVIFTLTAIRNKSFVFENAGHDFPQQIIYTPANRTLMVVIKGHTQNRSKEIPFSFVKL